jgi:hypothetical protein
MRGAQSGWASAGLGQVCPPRRAEGALSPPHEPLERQPLLNRATGSSTLPNETLTWSRPSRPKGRTTARAERPAPTLPMTCRQGQVLSSRAEIGPWPMLPATRTTSARLAKNSLSRTSLPMVLTVCEWRVMWRPAGKRRRGRRIDVSMVWSLRLRWTMGRYMQV